MRSSSSANSHLDNDQVNVYECEVRLKFRIIEENLDTQSRDGLIENLVDAYAYGADEYLEAVDSDVAVQAICEREASPEMRRQLLKLRNSSRMA